MRYLIPAVILSVALPASGVLVKAQAPSTPVPALSPATDARVEAHLLRVENAQLRAALARVQTELDTLRLGAERAELLEQLRRELQPPADAVFNWQTRQFAAPSPARKDPPQ